MPHACENAVTAPMDRSIKWMNESTTRATPVSTSEWERHRDEICHLYSTMTLEDVMTIMRIRHQFYPSKRQYITQFQKWGEYKYGRKEEAETRNSIRHGVPRLTSTPKSPRQLRLDQVLTVSKASDNKQYSLKNERPPVPTKERKLIGVTAQQLVEQHHLKETISTKIDQSMFSFPSSHQSESFGDTMYQEAIDMDEMDDYTLDQSPLSIEALSVQHPTCEASHAMEIDEEVLTVSNPSTTPSELDAFVSNGDEIRPHTDRPRLRQLQDVKLAADFLFASKLYNSSFDLYLELLKSVDVQSQPERHVTAWVIGCARSVSTPSQASAVRSILERRIADGIYKTQNHARTALFRLLLSDVCAKHGDRNGAKTQKRLAQEQSDYFRGNDRTTSGTHESFDLITYKYFVKDLKRKGHILDARDVTKRFVQRQNERSGTRSSTGHEGSIRSCLKWCISQLENDCRVHGSWRNLMCDGTLQIEMHNTALFSEFWQRWQQQNLGMKGYAGPCPVSLLWTEQIELEMGMSPSEFLMIMSRTILNAYPSVFSFLAIDTVVNMIDSNKLVEEHRIANRALIAAKELNNLSEDDLLSAFLESYIDHYRPMVDNPEAREYRDLSQHYIKAYLQDSLQVQLPDHTYDGLNNKSDMPADSLISGNDLSDALAAFDQDCPSASSDGLLYPTLARSLSSADLNSLRSLKNRIEGNLVGSMPQHPGVFQCLNDNSQHGGMLDSTASLASMVESAHNLMETASVKFMDRLVNPSFELQPLLQQHLASL